MNKSAPTNSDNVWLAKSLSITASTPVKNLVSESSTTGIPPPPAVITTVPVAIKFLTVFTSLMPTGFGEGTTLR